MKNYSQLGRRYEVHDYTNLNIFLGTFQRKHFQTLSKILPLSFCIPLMLYRQNISSKVSNIGPVPLHHVSLQNLRLDRQNANVQMFIANASGNFFQFQSVRRWLPPTGRRFHHQCVLVNFSSKSLKLYVLRNACTQEN